MIPSPGGTLLHYRLLEKIGEGGMGVVWKAVDTTLDREVAIKVLPPVFAENAERLARFEREARLLASLNHPNIATVHGLHEDRGVRFLAMELVTGQDLARRLARGPLPIRETLDVARQVATALEAAHENGVVHRDLKPANVLLTPDGTVKVLDFGLAKALLPESPETDLSRSPTMTARMTGAGVILGTAAYMSPEQARGREVDKRADVWAFGCVLYEMLTGGAPFKGDTVTDVLARVLEREPEWGALPRAVPPQVRRLLLRCLQKDALERLRDIGDARIELSAIKDGATSGLDETTVGARYRPVLAISLLILAVALGYAAARLTRGSPARSPTEPSTTRRLSILLPDGQSLARAQGIDLSRDGSTLVYSAGPPDGPPQLYLRRLDEFESRVIPNTTGGYYPEFSPDGERIAFFARSKLYVLSVSGGQPMELCRTTEGWGISWDRNDTLVFGNLNHRGLLRVSASGGPCETVVAPAVDAGESWYYYPEILPGGEWVLFSVATRDIVLAKESSIVAVSMRTNETRRLLEGADRAVFVEPDTLLFSRGEELFVVDFDPAQPRIEGTPTRLPDRIHENKVYGAHQLAAAGSEALAFAAPASKPSPSLVWVDRQGQEEIVLDDAEGVFWVDLSPDGSHAALTTGWMNHQFWILDMARGSRSRLNFDGDNHNATWSPDNRHLAFRSNRLGTEQTFLQPADGSREAELLIDEPTAAPESWSADGRYLLYSKRSEDRKADIWVHDLEQNTRREFLATRFNEERARFSPDGKWILYRSDETGRYELYVRPFASEEGRWTVSTDGAFFGGVWSPGGREIIYLTPGTKRKLMVVEVEMEPSFSLGTPREIAEGNFLNVDVSPDGQRFLVLKSGDSEPRREIRIVGGVSAR